MARSLTLADVSDELIAEHGLCRGGAHSYRCNDPRAALVPLAEIVGPEGRLLNEDAVRSILRGIRDGAELPPVELHPIRGANRLRLYHGMHRWRVAVALGYTAIPATLMSANAAESLGLY